MGEGWAHNYNSIENWLVNIEGVWEMENNYFPSSIVNTRSGNVI